MGFLRYDSDFMMSISRAADYVIVNLLAIIFSIPIITAGAAMTAKYYVGMKIVRGEEPSVLKAFWKSFRENFRQSTLIWVGAVLLAAFLVYDGIVIMGMQSTGVNDGFKIAFVVLCAVLLMSLHAVFALLARFHLTIGGAIHNAILFTLSHVPQMILLVFLEVLTYYVGWHYMEWFVLIWAIGTGITLYYGASMYAKQFGKVEEKKAEKAQQEEGENENSAEEVQETAADEQQEETENEEIVSDTGDAEVEEDV